MRSRPRVHPATTIAAMSGLLPAICSLCHAQTSTHAEVLPSAARVDDAALAEWIDDLGSAHQDERDAASERLMQSGASLESPVWQAAALTNRFEVRRRIRQVMRELFLTQRLGPPPAFLGISYVGYSIGPAGDERVPAGSIALLINDIVLWSAASRAGLQRRDLVVALNGDRILPPESPLEIPRWIKKQPLGTSCMLGVIRGGSARVLSDRDTPGFDPRAFSKIAMEVVLPETDPRLTPGSAALRITDIARADPRLALEKDDLLVALDGRPLPPEEPLELLQRWAKGEWVGLKATGGAAAAVPLPPRVGQMPSVQILRGGEYVTLEAVLGRRPTHLSGSASDRRGGVPAAEYEAWWIEWLSASGQTDDPRDIDAAWRLEP